MVNFSVSAACDLKKHCIIILNEVLNIVWYEAAESYMYDKANNKQT